MGRSPKQYSPKPEAPPAAHWAARLERPDPQATRVLRNTYGPDQEIIEQRLLLLRTAIGRFLERFGDRPLRVFRCPGRLNLRGMHVDTHGGFLNLATHQREVVVAVTPEAGDSVTFVNVEPRFAETSFRIQQGAARPSFRHDWADFIVAPDVRSDVEAQRGDWGNYLKGCLLSAQHCFPDTPLQGMSGVIGSDVPRGAALSSSAALCVGVIQAALARNGLTLGPEALILAARNGEWYTGSRCGVSDQAAMVLGGRDSVVNVALFASELDTSTATRFRLPDSAEALVVNSYTERSLSGAELVNYTRNRFAYSLAMGVLREEIRAQGFPEAIVAQADRLSNLTPAVLEPIGGTRTLLRLLQDIPESVDLSELRRRYDLPDFDQAYNQYFGTAPEALRPKRIGLRGPLLFGIAESERARLFPAALQEGDIERAGRLMTIGHDGDRKLNADGTPYVYDVSDAALARLVEQDTPIEACPGVYGASTPALDALVDTALEAGALGASLTGGGMAGTVLALCRAGETPRIAQALRQRIASPGYAKFASIATPLTDQDIAQAALPNTATASAGELRL